MKFVRLVSGAFTTFRFRWTNANKTTSNPTCETLARQRAPIFVRAREQGVVPVPRNMAFMDVENFKKVHSILAHFFAEKYGLDIASLNDGVLDVNRLIYNHMKAANAEAPKASLREKNKIVLRDAKDALIETYVKLREAADAQRVAEEQRLLGSRRALPDVPAQYKNDVMKDFGTLSQARQEELQQRDAPPGAMLAAQGATLAAANAHAAPKPDSGDMTAFSPDEFAQRFQQLQDRRSGAEASVAPMYTMDDGSNMMRAFAPDAAAAGPRVSAIVDSLPQSSGPQTYPDAPARVPHAHADPPAPPIGYDIQVKKTVHLLLCSSDRDVVAYPGRMSFRVRFGKPVWQMFATKVTQNQATIPGTRTLHFDGIPNASGCFFRGVALSPYNAAVAPPQPLLPTDVVGESVVSLPSDANACVAESVEDLVAVSVGEAVVAYRPGTDVPSVLTLYVEELYGDHDGTSDDMLRALASLTLTKIQSTGANGMLTAIYRPAIGRHEKVYSLPIQQLRYASIKLGDATGAAASESVDGVRVIGVDCGADGNVLLTLSVAPGASSFDVAVGDLVRVSELAMYAVSASDSDNVVSSANAAINSRGGYRVVSVAGSVVGLATALDATTSAFVHHFRTNNPYSSVQWINGYVTNLSKQLTLSLSLTMHRRAWGAGMTS